MTSTLFDVLKLYNMTNVNVHVQITNVLVTIMTEGGQLERQTMFPEKAINPCTSIASISITEEKDHPRVGQ